MNPERCIVCDKPNSPSCEGCAKVDCPLRKALSAQPVGQQNALRVGSYRKVPTNKE
jgi:hypothetical protein